MSKRAFTFVKILIIVAFVCVLALVLLPVSGGSGRPSKSICLSNIKQLSLSMLLYGYDFDDALPASRDDERLLWSDVVFPYYKNRQILKCPDDASKESLSYGVNRSIFLDDTVFLPKPPPKPPTYTSLESPTKIIMIGEIGTENDLQTPKENAFELVAPSGKGNDTSEARPSARHDGLVSLAFFDGHAKGMPLSQFYGKSNGLKKPFTPNQTPPDRWFAADTKQRAVSKVSE